uniref:Eukaryotic translation initiation factor 1A n=3 Tax=Agaricales TaxID=5338 RepID=A0A8H7XZX2_PSICU
MDFLAHLVGTVVLLSVRSWIDISLVGEQHRKQRKMLNPVFSIAHMREMVPIFYQVAYRLRDAMQKRTKDGAREIDLLLWMSRTALELIGQSGIGYSFDSLEEDVATHPYSRVVKKLAPVSFKLIFPRTYLLAPLVKIGTPKLRRAILNWLPFKTLHQLRDIVDTMHETSVKILDSKKKALMEGDEAVERQVGRGKDILSILLRANMNASDDDKLSDEEVLAQLSTLIFAAMDTTSGALSRILHLLSIHQDVQSKLREEITEARKQKGGDLPYDELVSLPYLDAICRETLRLYPPVSVVQRTTRQDVVLPLSNPIRGVDGKEITEIPIPNNTNVIVGIMASNRNPELWGPDSYEWKPERWLKPLPETLISAHLPGIYSNLMTFLGGGRACIGFKFSQLEMKVVLSVLIESFRFSAPSDKNIVWQMNGIATPTTDDNKGKGGKNRRRGKNENDDDKRELVFREDGQEYAQVIKMLGNGRLEAQCFDGEKRLAHIRGKMRKKVWINQGDIVLLSLRDFQDDKADVIVKYTADEARNLKAYGELPENAKINETDTFGEEDGECTFEFGDEGEVDIDDI